MVSPCSSSFVQHPQEITVIELDVSEAGLPQIPPVRVAQPIRISGVSRPSRNECDPIPTQGFVVTRDHVIELLDPKEKETCQTVYLLHIHPRTT